MRLYVGLAAAAAATALIGAIGESFCLSDQAPAAVPGLFSLTIC